MEIKCGNKSIKFYSPMLMFQFMNGSVVLLLIAQKELFVV